MLLSLGLPDPGFDLLPKKSTDLIRPVSPMSRHRRKRGMSTFGREADALAARARARRKQEKPSRLVVRCAADIEPQKVDWLWEQRLPLGKCTLVAGEGGLGKSMVLAWIAATVSRGGDWPCGEGQSPCGSVIILIGRGRCSRYHRPSAHGR